MSTYCSGESSLTQCVHILWSFLQNKSIELLNVHESTAISNIDYKFRPVPGGHPLGETGLPLKTGSSEEG